jgi:hypothetical protein
MKLGLYLSGAAIAAFLSTGLMSQPAPQSRPEPTAETVAACKALASRATGEILAAIPDAPTSVNTARVVPAGGTHGPADDDLPEICRVEGYINPTIGFLLRMPTKNWNGKFMMGGCGGPCGNYLEDRIDHALVRNYAVVTTDMGHKGSGWLWAYKNMQGQIDFAYRATHLTAKVAKEMIGLFYGQRAKWNYFIGCSTGGRQALIEAQRFPHDFHGIVSGAPVYDEVGDTPYFLEWNTRVNTAPDGSTILTAPKVELIRQGVLKQCDAKDGLKDGLLTDPASCNFDPKSLICRPGQDAAQCLTPQQADVAQKFRDGARNSKGEKLYWGMPWGSEDQWVGNFFGWVAADGKQTNYKGSSITGYMGYDSGPPGGPGFRPSDFDFDKDPERLDLTGIIHNPINPDLSRFQAAGGKLIMFHGWNDNNIPVEASIDYWNKAVRANGGEQATRRFFRFFAPPGINHCRGGDGGGEFDWISAIENWVERGIAPEQITAYHMVKPYPMVPRVMQDYGLTYSKFGRHPLKPEEYDRARPVYPWPAVARYSGRGDPADPKNWVKRESGGKGR